MNRIAKHYAHDVVVSRETDENNKVLGYAIECVDCWEVIIESKEWD